MLQDCVGKVGGFKISDALGTSIHRSSADDMVLNPTLDVLSAITHEGWNFQRYNRILIYMNFSSIVFIKEGNCRDNML